jgi:adenine-specific DNA methylase
MFQALPAYFGGKRRLCGEIFRVIPPPKDAPVFIDAFLGGGAVSLFAKARGHRVICNDLAERSRIVGEAVIVNGTVKLDPEDVLRLLAPNPDATNFVERAFCPDTFVTRHARFLDTACANIPTFTGEKQWLVKLLIVQFMIRSRVMGNFGAKQINRDLDAGNWDTMNPSFVKDAVARRIHAHPRRAADNIARAINLGIFSNGQPNEAHCSDVFDFLPRVTGDVAFFDPPYSGTLSYERALRVVDAVLRGSDPEPEVSGFSQRDALAFVERMFEAAQHIPFWVMSYGNAVNSLDEVVTLMRRFRSTVTGREIAYQHCTGLASEEHKSRNREFIIVGRA